MNEEVLWRFGTSKQVHRLVDSRESLRHVHTSDRSNSLLEPTGVVRDIVESREVMEAMTEDFKIQ